MNKIKIISRNSVLALWQSEFVKSKLQNIYPQLKVEIIGITTKGDKVLDRSLDKIGGKGLFIKELEERLLSGEADIAVHSLKDLPANLAPPFSLAAILKREDPTDALVSNKYTSLADIPDGGVIGTSSARRSALLKQYYPQLRVKLLRGNLQTRLAKLDNNEYDAIILASSGLIRLGLQDRICQRLNSAEFIPAIGQGALAVEVLADRKDLFEFLAPLTDPDSLCQVNAEREVGHYLAASCSIPIAVHAKTSNSQIELYAMVSDIETGQSYYAHEVGTKNDYLQVAQNCAEVLIRQGALNIIEKYK